MDLKKNILDRNLIDRFNSEIPIYELVIKTGVSLKKVGNNFMGLCPFHSEKTPSFSVSSEKNIALCMACRQGGRPVTFYSKFKKISISEAIKELSELFHLELPKQKIVYKNPLYEILESVHSFFKESLSLILKKKEYEDHPVKKYLLEERQLNLELVQEFGIGYAYDNNKALVTHLLDRKYKIEHLLKLGLVRGFINPKNSDETNYFDFFRNRIIFPLTNSEGQIVGFCGRTYQEDTKQPKYLFNIENDLFKKNRLLYRFFEHQQNIQEQKQIILCEGFFDVISFYKIGMKNVIATLGTNLSQEQILLLKQTSKKVIIAFDGDNSGKEAAIKIAQLLNNKSFIIKIMHLPSGFDPDSYILEKQNNIYFLKQKFEEITKDYIFQNIEDLLKTEFNKEIIKKYINNKLLKYHDEETQEYFQNKINEKYQILINLVSKETLVNKANKLKTKEKEKISVKGIVFDQDIEVDLLVQLFLNNKYIELIIEKSYEYKSINSDIIELFRIIRKYYNKYATEDEKDKRGLGVDLENFKNKCKEDLKRITDSNYIHNLISRVENNILFQQKKRISSQEYLSDIFHPFELKEHSAYRNKIKKEIQDIKNRCFQEDYEDEKKSFLDELKLKQKELIKIENDIYECKNKCKSEF
ncbi:DNA primase [Candidatus Phytoplasma luffae]|uniref:DNA primase n=1 Tax=Loofah witches'-broom phytoplasma TaxID=35773 RepID=A0A975FKL6_LOWBP|nr:DNA primase [Candidatus Phytoplasma luffae]QTX02671.1 DNA primase [Candidatus Phytoplasma luffae]